MATVLQLVGLIGIAVACVLLVGWVWTLLIVSAGSVAVGYAWEHKAMRPAPVEGG